MNNTHIIGVFEDESLLVQAMKKLKSQGVNIKDVYGPSADHDLIKHFTRESRLPYFSVIIGLFTLITTFAFVYYVTVIDYPLHYGGKPVFSFPPMVVVMFLVCILVTGGLSTFAFLGRTQLFPGKKQTFIDPRAADDRFFLVLDKNYNPEEIKGWLTESGAEDILEKEIDE
jgi:hypothetical protein